MDVKIPSPRHNPEGTPMENVARLPRDPCGLGGSPSRPARHRLDFRHCNRGPIRPDFV